MNLFSPFYDPDVGTSRMSVDDKGSWVHASVVHELQSERAVMVTILRHARERAEKAEKEFAAQLRVIERVYTMLRSPDPQIGMILGLLSKQIEIGGRE